jgi:hypothetical protein
VTAPYVTSTFDYYSNAVGAHLAGTPLTEDYTEFLHLLGPDGQKVAQADGRPPRSVWITICRESSTPRVEIASAFDRVDEGSVR